MLEHSAARRRLLLLALSPPVDAEELGALVIDIYAQTAIEPAPPADKPPAQEKEGPVPPPPSKQRL